MYFSEKNSKNTPGKVSFSPGKLACFGQKTLENPGKKFHQICGNPDIALLYSYWYMKCYLIGVLFLSVQFTAYYF